jgi:hypothetical protein
MLSSLKEKQWQMDCGKKVKNGGKKGYHASLSLTDVHRSNRREIECQNKLKFVVRAVLARINSE